MFASKTGCNSTCCLDSGEQICYFDHAHQMLTRILRKFEYFGNIIKKKKPVNNSFTGFCCFLLLLSAERKSFVVKLIRLLQVVTKGRFWRINLVTNGLHDETGRTASIPAGNGDWRRNMANSRRLKLFCERCIWQTTDPLRRFYRCQYCRRLWKIPLQRESELLLLF